MQNLLVFAVLLFGSLFGSVVEASPRIPTCNDPDFRCRKACKIGKKNYKNEKNSKNEKESKYEKDAKKSRRLKNDKKFKAGGAVKNCDWIDALPADRKERICQRRQGGKEISHSCPETCLDKVCEGGLSTNNPVSEGVCLQMNVADPCPSVDEIAGIEVDDTCTIPIGTNCVYNGIEEDIVPDLNDYNEDDEEYIVFNYECRYSGWWYRFAFECPPTEDEFKRLYYDNGRFTKSDLPGRFRVFWSCSYPRLQSNPIPYTESVTTYTYRKDKKTWEVITETKTKFDCPDEENEMKTLLDVNKDEICNQDVNGWSCPYSQAGRSCHNTYRCYSDSTVSTTIDFQCPTTRVELESLLEENKRELCNDSIDDWACGYGDTTHRCRGGVFETIVDGDLYDGVSAAEEISNPDSCPDAEPFFNDECSISEDDQCAYAFSIGFIEHKSVYSCPNPQTGGPRRWQRLLACPEMRSDLLSYYKTLFPFDPIETCAINGFCDDWDDWKCTYGGPYCGVGAVGSIDTYGCIGGQCITPSKCSIQC